MKTNVYAIMDAKVSAFMTPFFSHNDQTAMRSIKAALNHPESAISASPEDYSLYRIGIFCDESGVIEGYPTPDFIVRADNLSNKSDVSA